MYQTSSMDCVLNSVSFLLATLITLIAIKLYNKLTLGKCTSTRDMTGKVIVVTGGNTGIGKATVMDLARRNAQVIMGCRDLKSGQEAARDIAMATGNTKVTVMKLDLASLESIRQFSDELKGRVTRLHVLINNAGVADLLEASAPSRIVNVSSLASRISNLSLLNLNSDISFDRFMVYGNSKLALIIFSKMLADRLRGTGVTVNSLHPGAVNTDLFRRLPAALKWFTKVCLWLFYKTPTEGAQTSIYLAVSEEVEGVSGEYFSDCAVASTSSKVNDLIFGKKLWNLTHGILRLSPS